MYLVSQPLLLMLTLMQDLDVDGHTELDDLNVSGVSTFAGAIDANGDLDVDGHTELDDLNVSGVSTFTGAIDANGDLDVDGHTELDDLNVSGVSTFTGAIDANGDLDVDGHTELDDVNVSGVSTFTGAIDANGDLDVDGHTELDDVNVSGVSTFASDVDLNGDLDVDGHTELDDLNVSGVSTFTGAIDANGDLDVDGHTELDDVNVSGVSTFTGAIDANGDLDVDGHTELDDLNVSGVSTFASNVDINAGLDVDGHTELDDLNVSGVSTFASDVDINAGLDVNGHTELDDVNVSGVSTFTGAIDANGDLDVDGHTELDDLNVSGVSTFTGAIDANGDLDVDGHTELDTLNVSIAATTASLTLANIGVAVTAILDEDDLVSDRDDALATQQSIKKYVDNQVTSQDLDFVGDTGSGSVDLDSETFTIAGTANEIETVGSGNTLTVGLPNEVNITTSLTVGSATTITGSGIIAGIVTGTLDNDLTLATSGTGLSGSATYNNSGVVTFTVASDATDVNTPSTIVSRDGSGNFSAGTISADLTGVASTATKLETSRTFELTGDVVASQISFDGTGNVSLAATIQPNSVALGDDTTGDYVSSISGTSNQIAVDVTSGEGTTPVISIPDNPTLPGTTVTIANDLQVNRDLNVNGNITVGGTSATLFTETLKVSDSDIVLGFRTDAGGNEVSNDTTANHGGVAVASTEGSPLISLIGAGETLPTTYKKIMWFNQGSLAGLGTDAWLINYGVGIGSTQFPTGTRLAAGSVQFTENDLAVIRNINASGIVTATNGFVGNLTGTASTASNLTRSVIAGNGLTGGGELTADRTLTVGVGTGITINSDNVELRNSENLTGGTITKWDDGNGQLTDSLVTETGTIVNVGSGITFYTSTGIISATAYYGNGGNLEDIVGEKLEGITANFKPFDSGTVILGDTLAVAEVNIIDNSTVGFITAVGFGSTAQYYFNDVTAVGLTTDASVNTTGIITSGGFTVSGGVFTGDGSGLTNLSSVAAGVTVSDNDIVRGTTSVLNFGSDIDVSLISAGIVTVSLNNNQNFTGIVTISTLEVSGVSTFTETISANGDLDVDGHTELDDLNVSGVSTFTDVEIDGALYDSNNATGSNGQLLTSIGTGVSWTNTTTTATGQNILNVSASDTYKLTSSDIVSGVATAGFISPTVVMTGTGSVGIGTTNPKVKLQIDGILGFGTVYDDDEELLYTNIRIGDETTGGGGFNNIFMGIGAGNSNIDGSYNNFFGDRAGYYNTGGYYNNFLGDRAGYRNITGSIITS